MPYSNKVTITVEQPKPPNPCASVNGAMWNISISPQIVKEGSTATATFQFPQPNTSYCYNLYGFSKGTCSVSSGCSESVTFTAEGTGIHYATVGYPYGPFYFWQSQTGWYSYSTPLPYDVAINGSTYYRFYPEAVTIIGNLCPYGQAQCTIPSKYAVVDIQNGIVYLPEQLAAIPDPNDSNKLWLQVESNITLGYIFTNEPVDITP